MSQHALRLHGRRQLHNHRVAHVLAPTPNINTTCIAPRHTAPACTPYSGYCPTGSTKSTTTRASSPSPCWTWPQKLDSRSFSSEPARNRRIGSVLCSPSLAPKQHPTLPPPRPSSRPSLPPPPSPLTAASWCRQRLPLQLQLQLQLQRTSTSRAQALFARKSAPVEGACACVW